MAFLSNINFSFLLLMLYFLFEITYKFLGSISIIRKIGEQVLPKIRG
jgi:hypothetical protein